MPPPDPFRPLSKLTARWVQLDGHGAEHLTLEANAGRITATSVVTGTTDGVPFGAWYQLFLTSSWQVKAVSIHLTDTRWFIAKSPEPGVWKDGDGRRLKALDGCIDVDLSATPFSNTLPIRRLAPDQGASHELEVAFIPFDTLEPAKVRQRYTCIQPAGRYLYEGMTTGFKTELTTDNDGLVVDYPGLFKRLG